MKLSIIYSAKKQLEEAEKENQSLNAQIVQREVMVEDMKNHISLKVEEKNKCLDEIKEINEMEV